MQIFNKFAIIPFVFIPIYLPQLPSDPMFESASTQRSGLSSVFSTLMASHASAQPAVVDICGDATQCL